MRPDPLPLLISVPHGGLTVPPELQASCRLTAEEIAADGDVGARQIYDLAAEVLAFQSTDIARAVVDQNRAEGDRRKDGIVKTHTCWDVPIWEPTPSEEEFEQLLAAHYRPYHARLTELAGDPRLRLALDCHTMAAVGPPVGPDPGRPRPMVCLGDLGGQSCPPAFLEGLAAAMRAHFPGEIAINVPFQGGFVTRFHSQEMPWVQVEMSRAEPDGFGVVEKRAAFLAALRQFCAESIA